MDSETSEGTTKGTSKNSVWRLLPSWLGGSTMILAVVSGLLYVTGFARHEVLFIKLGIPVRSVDMPANLVALYGLSYWLAVVVIVAFLIYLVAAAVAAFSNKESAERKQGEKSNTSQNGNDLMWFAISLIVAVMVVSLGIYRASNSSEEEAEKYISGDCTVMDITLANGEQVSGCYVVDSKDGMWFVSINKDAKDAKDKKPIFGGPLYLQRADVKKMTLHSSAQPDASDEKVQPAAP